MNKIITKDEIFDKIQRPRREQSLRIVTTNGCYDLLHIGHVNSLQLAAKLGDMLIVLVNSDDSIRAIKGSKRPIVCERDRLEMLAALECVDYAILFSEEHPGRLLGKIAPDVHVKAGHGFGENSRSRQVVEKHGGICVSIPLYGDISTSSLIEKIVKMEAE